MSQNALPVIDKIWVERELARMEQAVQATTPEPQAPAEAPAAPKKKKRRKARIPQYSPFSADEEDAFDAVICSYRALSAEEQQRFHRAIAFD